MRSQPLDAGETKVYDAPLNTVTPAARQTVLAAGLDVDAVSQPDSLTWMIIAKKGMSFFSYGEVVRVVVQQTPEGAVAVRVFTRRAWRRMSRPEAIGPNRSSAIWTTSWLNPERFDGEDRCSHGRAGASRWSQ